MLPVVGIWSGQGIHIRGIRFGTGQGGSRVREIVEERNGRLTVVFVALPTDNGELEPVVTDLEETAGDVRIIPGDSFFSLPDECRGCRT